jgi:hypothetical protein
MYSDLPDADYTVNVRDADLTACAGEEEVLTVVAGAALPVALTTFTGHTAGKQNMLEWAVAREEAFSHYEVERSADGSNNWEMLGEIAGAENARQEQGYNFTDLNPLPSTYYRLRMIDLDGSSTFSSILQLQREVEGKILVYPNPNNGRFTVQLPAGETAQLTLVNLNGKVVWQGNSSDVSVTTNDLPSGIYFLSAETTAARLTQRVIVR